MGKVCVSSQQVCILAGVQGSELPVPASTQWEFGLSYSREQGWASAVSGWDAFISSALAIRCCCRRKAHCMEKEPVDCFSEGRGWQGKGKGRMKPQRK